MKTLITLAFCLALFSGCSSTASIEKYRHMCITKCDTNCKDGCEKVCIAELKALKESCSVMRPPFTKPKSRDTKKTTCCAETKKESCCVSHK